MEKCIILAALCIGLTYGCLSNEQLSGSAVVAPSSTTPTPTSTAAASDATTTTAGTTTVGTTTTATTTAATSTAAATTTTQDDREDKEKAERYSRLLHRLSHSQLDRVKEQQATVRPGIPDGHKNDHPPSYPNRQPVKVGDTQTTLADSGKPSPAGVTTMPSSETTAPTTQKAATTSEITTPSTEKVTPSTEITTPATEITTPATEITQPSTNPPLTIAFKFPTFKPEEIPDKFKEVPDITGTNLEKIMTELENEAARGG